MTRVSAVSEKQYALYRGDEFLTIGTQKEIAEELGVKESSVRFYGSPSYRKRTDDRGLILIELEDE